MKTHPVIVSRKVEDLIPYARNSRTHSDAQVAQIAASVREFGWTNPVLIDGENGIIAGHGRDLAPLGVELLAQTVAAYAEGGYVHGAAQDEALATWEPSIDRPPAFRPDLVMLGLSRPHPWYEAECA